MTKRSSLALWFTWSMMLPLLAGSDVVAQDQGLATFNAISEALVCQCGCAQVLGNCGMLNCGSATPMRAVIKDEIAKDTPKEEIIAKFVRQYGEVVLSAPPARGFNLTAWIMPFVVLLGGAVVAYRTAVRMKRLKSEVATPAAATPPAAASSYDATIEKELESFEERE